LVFSPDGEKIVSGNQDGTLCIWDAKTKECIATMRGHTDAISSVAFSPNGKRIVSGSSNGVLKYWDLETGQLLMTLRGHFDAISSVAFSPNGKRIVSGSSDGVLKYWDLEIGVVLKTLKGHTDAINNDAINNVVFSPDGKIIVSGISDRNLRFWNPETGELLKTLKGHTDAITNLAFSPDGKRIVSGGLDHTLRIWDVESGESIGNPLERGKEKICFVAFSSDGRQIFSGSQDYTLKIWKSVMFNPNYPSGYINLAKTMEVEEEIVIEGKSLTKQELYKKALYINPNDITACIDLGNITELEGRTYIDRKMMTRKDLHARGLTLFANYMKENTKVLLNGNYVSKKELLAEILDIHPGYVDGYTYLTNIMKEKEEITINKKRMTREELIQKASDLKKEYDSSEPPKLPESTLEDTDKLLKMIQSNEYKRYIKSNVTNYFPIDIKHSMKFLSRISELLHTAYSSSKGSPCAEGIIKILGKYQTLIKSSSFITKSFNNRCLTAIDHHILALCLAKEEEFKAAFEPLSECKEIAEAMIQDSEKLIQQAMELCDLSKESLGEVNKEVENRRMSNRTNYIKINTQQNIQRKIKKILLEIESIVEQEPISQLFEGEVTSQSVKNVLSISSDIQLDPSINPLTIESSQTKQAKMQLKDEHRKLDAELAESIKRVKQYASENEHEQSMIDSLQVVIQTMGRIKTTFENTRLFWINVKKFCSSFQDQDQAERRANKALTSPAIRKIFIRDIHRSGMNWATLGFMNIKAHKVLQQADEAVDNTMNNFLPINC